MWWSSVVGTCLMLLSCRYLSYDTFAICSVCVLVLLSSVFVAKKNVTNMDKESKYRE
jgi:hypothetical protein